MKAISRRSVLGGAVATVGAALAKCATGGELAADRQKSHPLDGVQREKIKITDIRVTLLSYKLPRDKIWMTAQIICWKTDAILVEVFTDQGIVGIGGASQYGGPELVKRYIEQKIKPTLLGRNPFDVERLQSRRLGDSFGEKAAWAGVDVAIWDIIGKAKGKPVYELLATDGPPNPRIRMYASGGVEYAWYKRPMDLIDEAVRHKENGYTAFKFRIGTSWKHAGMSISTSRSDSTPTTSRVTSRWTRRKAISCWTSRSSPSRPA